MIMKIEGLKLSEGDDNNNNNNDIDVEIISKEPESSETVFRVSNNFDDDDLVPFSDSISMLNTNTKPIERNIVEKDDDDMMDFLLDDSNF
jgi:hypothetical protein